MYIYITCVCVYVLYTRQSDSNRPCRSKVRGGATNGLLITFVWEEGRGISRPRGGGGREGQVGAIPFPLRHSLG